MNNIRARHSVESSSLSLMPSGTTSNEALHSEINLHFRQTVKIHQSTLRLKCKTLCLKKQLTHNAALYRPTTRQAASSQVLARILAESLWTPATWREWCGELLGGRVVRKATLRGVQMRACEVDRVAAWLRKRPAAVLHRETRRRTPFALTRVDEMRRAGRRPRKEVARIPVTLPVLKRLRRKTSLTF